MILYHGSTVSVEKPEILAGNSFLDFGCGFYTTTSYEQALRWARIKMKRLNTSVGYVSAYEFDFEKAKEELNIKRFESADMKWLMFVTSNRNGERTSAQAEMHIGPVADDNVYQSIRLFETGILDAEDTVKRLKTELLHDQWTFHSEKALSFCKHIRSDEIVKENCNEQRTI